MYAVNRLHYFVISSVNRPVSVLIGLLYVFASLFSTPVQSQTPSEEALVAAYVYQLSGAVQWKSTGQVERLKLNYFGASEAQLTELKGLERREVGGLPISVRHTPSLQTAINDANILLVDELNNASLSEIFARIDRQAILVITMNASDRTLTHINLLSVDNRITFELNRYTLAYNNLPVDIDVMVLGGREVDIALLLRELQANLAAGERQLSDVNAVIASQQATIESQLTDISSSRQTLDTLRKQLAQEGAEKSKLEIQIANLNSAVETAQNTLATNNQTIKEREISLARQLEEITQNEQLIVQQQSEMRQQSDTIRKTAEMLSETQSTIAEQTQQIQQSEELISTQNAVIIVIIVLLLIILIVFVAFLRRRERLKATHQALLDTKDQLVESEKMASLGFLVAGVAHEMNTPLGNVIASASVLEHQLAEIEHILHSGKPSKSELLKAVQSSKEAIDLIESNQKRAANLISRFKELSSTELQKESKPIKIRQLLEDCYQVHMTTTDQSKLSLILDCPENVIIHCNVSALTNVVTQLMHNASVHGSGSEQKPVVLEVSCITDGDWIDIRFQNDGKPILEESIRQLFEPFFTTKRHEGLVGLGLHICYNITQNHLGGKITYESMPEKVCFVLSLPAKQ